MKRYLLLLLLSIILTACDTTETQPAETVQTPPVPPMQVETTIPETAPQPAETTETEVPRPPVQEVYPEWFDGIRTMQTELTARVSAGEKLPIDLANLRELVGLPGDFTDCGVEWGLGETYCITYGVPAEQSSENRQTIAFTPFSTEEKLQTATDNILRGSGTYEELCQNTLVSAVVKTDWETDLGVLYACTYNTSKKTGLKLVYHEYTEPATENRYVLSQMYDSDGTVRYFTLSVFRGAASFQCLGFDMAFTLTDAFDLLSVPVE